MAQARAGAADDGILLALGHDVERLLDGEAGVEEIGEFAGEKDEAGWLEAGTGSSGSWLAALLSPGDLPFGPSVFSVTWMGESWRDSIWR